MENPELFKIIYILLFFSPIIITVLLVSFFISRLVTKGWDKASKYAIFWLALAIIFGIATLYDLSRWFAGKHDTDMIIRLIKDPFFFLFAFLAFRQLRGKPSKKKKL